MVGEVALGDRNNMVFSGTAATYGHGARWSWRPECRTELGRIAGMLKEAPHETTPLQKELDRLGKLPRYYRRHHRRRDDRHGLLVEGVRGFAALFDVSSWAWRLRSQRCPKACQR